MSFFKTRFQLTSAAASFGLIAVLTVIQPAAAAEGIDYNSSRSNKSNAVAAPDGGGHSIESCWLRAAQKSSEIEAELQRIHEQLLAVQALSVELRSLSDECAAAQAAAEEGSQEEVALLDEASRIFTEQIAALLEPSLAQQVSSSLEDAKRVRSDSTLTRARSEEANASLEELESMLSELVLAADAAQKKGGNVEFEWKVEEGES